MWLRKHRRTSDTLYQKWLTASASQQKKEAAEILKRLSVSQSQPLISIIMPVYNVAEKWLRAAIESVLAQSYTNWELCIADDNSSAPHIKPVLKEYSAKDSRIKVVFRKQNGHISAASNSALELATGDFAALLDNDDELAPDALLYVAREILNHPAAALIYTDEDKINENDKRFDPAFKPDWSPDLFYSMNFINHLSVFRRDILTEIGGFLEAANGSQDYDLILRFIEQIEESQIRHIPRILYHWRALKSSVAFDSTQKFYAHEAAHLAIREHLKRKEISAEVAKGFENYHRIIYALPKIVPKISVIIESGKLDKIFEKSLNLLVSETEYQNFEIIVGSNHPNIKSFANKIKAFDVYRKIKFCPVDNLSRAGKLNRIAHKADGEVLVFLEANAVSINKDWLCELACQTLRTEIGAVGGKLLYKDETVHSAGYILGINGICGRAHYRFPRQAIGNLARLQVISNFSAVPIECFAVKLADFNSFNGFDSQTFPGNLFDVDFCLRLAARGKRNLLTPYAEMKLISAVQVKEPSTLEKENLLARWQDKIVEDPFYNPNLTRNNESFQVEFPPRII